MFESLLGLLPARSIFKALPSSISPFNALALSLSLTSSKATKAKLQTKSQQFMNKQWHIPNVNICAKCSRTEILTTVPHQVLSTIDTNYTVIVKTYCLFGLLLTRDSATPCSEKNSVSCSVRSSRSPGRFPTKNSTCKESIFIIKGRTTCDKLYSWKSLN